MSPVEDPNIKRLHKLADAYWAAEAEAKRLRIPLDAHIQEMKRQGYAYSLLARESGFAQGTVQLIIAKE